MVVDTQCFRPRQNHRCTVRVPLCAALQAPACKVALVSPYIPKDCEVATFTATLAQRLRAIHGLQKVVCLSRRRKPDTYRVKEHQLLWVMLQMP